MRKQTDTFSVPQLFGLSEEKANKIEKGMEHCKIEAETIPQLAEMLDIVNGGEIAYRTFLFALEVQKNQNKNMIEKMFNFMKEG